MAKPDGFILIPVSYSLKYDYSVCMMTPPTSFSVTVVDKFKLARVLLHHHQYPLQYLHLADHPQSSRQS